MSFSASSSSLITDQTFISVRMVTVDHYLADPIPELDPTYSHARSYNVRKVPVLRIFGPNASGQKCCLHLHGIFPYLYVPVPGSNVQPGFQYKLAASLDKALNISMGATESKVKRKTDRTNPP